MIWLGIALVTLLVLALLLLPLLRRDPDNAAAAKAHRAVFLAQLAELERDAAEGRLSASELAGARLEIQRRLLAVGEDRPTTDAGRRDVRRLAIPLILAVLTPALLLYVWQGAPDLPDQPARLRPEIATSQGEALVTAAEGRVTAEAAQAFGRALAIDARDPKAQYYLALAKAQEGDLPAAITAWQKLLAQAPPQAAWRGSVEMSIAEAARMLNRDPAEFGVTAAPPPTPAVDNAMINDMVARLEARLQDKPDDVEGWLRLGKSWEVLGNKAKSLAAYAQAAERAPQRADVLLSYARALYPPDSDVPPPPDFIALLRRVLALEPDQPEALWFIGHAEADAGNKDAARTLWQKLRDGLPPDSPPRKAVEKALQGLG